MGPRRPNGTNAIELLDPAAASRLGKLELVARTLVEGFLKGAHFSSSKGSSVEFAEHRPYVPGDEIRHIDWRSYARSDRFYLKQFDDETNVRATIALDASGSMGFSGAAMSLDATSKDAASPERGATGGISKFRYASCLAAAIGHLLIGQRDAVGLILAGRDGETRIPPKATPQHLRGIFATIEATAPAGSAGFAASLHRLAGSLRTRSLVVAISDFIEDPQAILRSVAHIRHRNSDAILFHVLDPAEESFPFTGWTLFRDMEDPSVRLRLDARQCRLLYRENILRHLETLRKGCTAAGADYELVRTSRPFELALATYLDARHRRNR